MTSQPLQSSAASIRAAFIEYFAKLGHTVVASSSLVPHDDPTLLFTNAGMVPFKDTFLGQEQRPYTKAVSSQRCVRAGGKHNDLENVGYTARHHTFFEMLGNFSFGDYFKREAIQYAWDFLTAVLHLPPEKLWVTVYRDDDEAAHIWLQEIGVSPKRFSRCGEKDNFWSMGDTGPCGPCTEIFFDHGPEIAGGPPGSPEADGDRYIEIWNLVFMQFNRDNNGQLHPLPKPSVDTGMGLERIAAVVQGVHNNYEIDILSGLIRAMAALARIQDLQQPSLKVIADHIRACAFLIADGIVPSNEGRGYVLRRIIRRAIRHGHQLGVDSPFFNLLVQPLVDAMGDAYPELMRNQCLIEQILEQEEMQFSRTLEQGLRLLNDYLPQAQDQTIAGEVAFKLYDTYGFPLDLTADIAREHGLAIDIKSFEQLMQQQRAQSQQASAFRVDYGAVDRNLASVFDGYEQDQLQTEILYISPDDTTIILKHTPFYAESGGQVGDLGSISSGDAVFKVVDTRKQGQSIVHYGHLLQGRLQEKQQVKATLDLAHRSAVRLNHTATHLLHQVLKNILGDKVEQRGSLVDAARARFDFSFGEALTPGQLVQIERCVNDKIRENIGVSTEIMPLEKATAAGAMALFGEKYAAEVRVLSVGDFSKELCGGTHVQRTGDIGLFKITSEYGVASGIRRIEWLTGDYALAWVNQKLQWLTQTAEQLKTTEDSIPQKLMQWIKTSKERDKQLSELRLKWLVQSSSQWLSEVKYVKQMALLIKQFEGLSLSELRQILDQLKTRLASGVIVLISTSEDKVQVLASVTPALLQQGVPDAIQWVRHICGKGGGRDDLAQGGGALTTDFATKIGSLEQLLE